MGNKLAAEAFGTFWLVLGGCGSAVLAAGFPEVGIGLVTSGLPQSNNFIALVEISFCEAITQGEFHPQ